MLQAIPPSFHAVHLHEIFRLKHWCLVFRTHFCDKSKYQFWMNQASRFTVYGKDPICYYNWNYRALHDGLIPILICRLFAVKKLYRLNFAQGNRNLGFLALLCTNIVSHTHLATAPIFHVICTVYHYSMCLRFKAVIYKLHFLNNHLPENACQKASWHWNFLLYPETSVCSQVQFIACLASRFAGHDFYIPELFIELLPNCIKSSNNLSYVPPEIERIKIIQLFETNKPHSFLWAFHRSHSFLNHFTSFPSAISSAPLVVAIEDCKLLRRSLFTENPFNFSVSGILQMLRPQRIHLEVHYSFSSFSY